MFLAKGQTYAFYDEEKKPLKGVQLGIEIMYIVGKKINNCINSLIFKLRP